MPKKTKRNQQGAKGKNAKKGKKGAGEIFMEAVDGSAEFIADQVTDKKGGR